jgi:DNA polymerase III sliding clamp (beta) subunit (PCNA family)
MSNQINRVELLKKLTMAKPAVSAQAYIPILSHFMFDGDSVTAYNDINAITVLCDTGIHGCLPAELLIKTLSSFSSDAVLFVQDTGQVIVSAGRSKIKLPTLPAADFPYSPNKWQHGASNKKEDKCIGSFKMTDVMLKGLKKCLIGVGTDTAHPATMGVTLDPMYSKTQAAFYSTDNTTLSRFLFNTAMEIPGDMHVIMPTFFCNQILSLVKGTEAVEIEIYAGSLVAIFADGTLLFTKTIADLEPMDFPKVIDKYMDTDSGKTLDIPDVFDQSIERALLIQSAEPNKTTLVTVENKKLVLESVSKYGESRDEMSYAGDDVQFKIDSAKVKRVTPVTTKMSLLPKVLVLSDDNQEFIHLIAHCSM